MRSIERVSHAGIDYALILGDTHRENGLEFLTEDEASLQLAYMCHPAGKRIQAHVHTPVVRTVSYTYEVLFIKRGRVRVDFFDDARKQVASRELSTGDTILLMHGGHGFEVLEELEMIEVKQGPYAGDLDKTKF